MIAAGAEIWAVSVQFAPEHRRWFGTAGRDPVGSQTVATVDGKLIPVRRFARFLCTEWKDSELGARTAIESMIAMEGA